MKKVIFIMVGLIILLCILVSANKVEAISTLNTQISNIQSQLDQLQIVTGTLSRKVPNYAFFTPDDEGKGYATLHANVGYFLVSLDSLKKYGNGYRATFNIGNPNAMIFEGIKVEVQWSFKSEEIDINKSLLPGAWNKVSVVLSPATANETRYIRLALKTNKVYLSRDLRESSD